MHRVTDVISVPAGFRRLLRNVFHRYRQNTLCSQASDHTDDFMNQRIECYVNNATNLRPIHYVMLYPQDDNRIVAVDSVTALHPIYKPTTHGTILVGITQVPHLENCVIRLTRDHTRCHEHSARAAVVQSTDLVGTSVSLRQ